MGRQRVAYFYDPDVGNFHYGKAMHSDDIDQVKV